MANPYLRAPHAEPARPVAVEAPNAALLIDFDNVTMGMRSDLAKELKHLLNSDIIKGKVTVQRAYADWRRYPQYIVPLSEASIDLIFAPAYGSSKKNATDIRMAIDGMELVFIRPEIGTFILLTGDSDFSSLVLKLKEYGKYVIGIGIQESSSDILVQNCDEYYSYTTLTGLTKTSDSPVGSLDPWQCVEEAVSRMAARGDVMRSDRLKQVMLELSPSFDERNLGFKKFSRFLVEAAGKGLLHLERSENGQYEVSPAEGGRGRKSRQTQEPTRNGDEMKKRGRRGSSRRESGRGSRSEPSPSEAGPSGDVSPGLALLHKAMDGLRNKGRKDVRDSDVKRKMLSLDRSFDEGALGFAKFSKFLLYAEEQGTVALQRLDTGNYTVRLPDGGAAPASREEAVSGGDEEVAADPAASPVDRDGGSAPAPEAQAPSSAAPATSAAAAPRTGSGRLGPRRGDGSRRQPGDAGPVLLEDQIVAPRGRAATPEAQQSPEAPSTNVARSGDLDTKALGLPTTRDSMVSYLANRYRGVGLKTAEALVEAFGTRLFSVLQNEPEEVRAVVQGGRADQVLSAWADDYSRRTSRKDRAPGGDARQEVRASESPETAPPEQTEVREEVASPVDPEPEEPAASTGGIMGFFRGGRRSRGRGGATD